MRQSFLISTFFSLFSFFFFAFAFAGPLTQAKTPAKLAISDNIDHKLSFQKSLAIPEKSFTISSLKKLLPLKTIKVFEPHENIEITYDGFKFVDLLSRAETFGEDWQKAEEILFTCVDGYQPSIPVADFKKHDSYLVFQKTNGKEPFTIHNKGQNEKNVPLGPFYLVWDNLNHKDLLAEGASGWPYQVVKVQLIKFSDRFPKLAPTAQTTPAGHRGFLLYRKYCLTCHAYLGEGGEKGPDLAEVTTRYDRQWLQKFISNPRSVRPDSNMTQINLHLKNREQAIADVIAYLQEKDKEKKSSSQKKKQ